MRALALLLIPVVVGCPVVAPSVAGFAAPCSSDADCAGVCADGVCRRRPAAPGDGGTQDDAGPPFDADGWRYRVDVDVNNPTDQALRDAPFVLRFDAADLAPGAAAADARDVRFVDDDGRLWPHEIVSWPAAGERVVWVRARAIPAQGGTSVWMLYDNPDAEDVSDPSQVFARGFRSVWHLDEAPDGATDGVVDVRGFAPGTSENMDGSARVDGRVGGALAFDGVDDRVRADSWSSPSGPFTAQLWFRFDAGQTSADPRRDLLYHGNSGRPHVTFNREGDGRLKLHINIDGTPFDDVETDATSWEAGRWTFLAFTFNGTDWRTYVDGVAAGPVRTHPGASSESSTLYLGATSGGGNAFPGALDEVHFSTVARSAAWIEFQHATQLGSVAELGTPEEIAP